MEHYEDVVLIFNLKGFLCDLKVNDFVRFSLVSHTILNFNLSWWRNFICECYEGILLSRTSVCAVSSSALLHRLRSRCGTVKGDSSYGYIFWIITISYFEFEHFMHSTWNLIISYWLLLELYHILNSTCYCHVKRYNICDYLEVCIIFFDGVDLF